MQRTPHQLTRRFLSSAFRFDTKECSMKGVSVLPTAGGMPRLPNAAAAPHAETNMFRIAVKDIPEAVKVDAASLHLTLFDQDQKVFFGATHVIDVATLRSAAAAVDAATGATLAAPPPSPPLLFYSSTTKSILLVVEFVRANALVSVWGSVSLGALASGVPIELREGSAQLLFIERTAWPVFPPLGLQLTVDAMFVRDTSESKSIAALLPAGVFVDAAFGKDFGATKALPRFRLVVSEVDIRPTALPSATLALSTQWSLLLLAHNTFRQLTTVVELELARTSDNTLKSNGTCEVPGIPLHDATALVAVLRCRVGDRSHKIVGYSVIHLCAEATLVRDEDVAIGGVPLVKGPFSSADPRTVALDVEDPYGSAMLTMGCLLQYFDTPIPARQIVEDVEAELLAAGGRPQQQQHPKHGGDGGAATAVVSDSSLPPSAGTVGAPGEGLPTASGALLHVTPGVMPTTDQQQQQYAGGGGGGSSAHDLQMYKLLCTVLDEMQQLKDMQTGLEKQMEAAAAAAAVAQQQQLRGGGGGAGGRTGMPVPPLDADSHLLNVVDLAPRRLAVSSTARGTITHNLAQLRSPFSNLPLRDMDVSDTAFPDSFIGIRFEGATVTSAVSLPPKLVVMFSFATLPIQQLGVMVGTLVAEEEQCKSFQLGSTAAASSNAQGFIWHEPVDHPQTELVRRSKASGHLYLHVYDAVTLFYVCTATVKLSAFHRPPNAPSVSTSVDAALHVDLSFSEQQVPAGVFPIIPSVGVLHLTLFAVGYTDTSLAATSRVSVVRSEPKGAGAVGGLVIAAKLAALENLTNLPEGVRGGSPKDPPMPVATTSGGSSHVAMAGASIEKRSTLHQQRANYVKSLLQQNGGALPGVPASHFSPGAGSGSGNGGGGGSSPDAGDNEYKLRYADKKRDEIKSQRIAEALRDRITTTVQLHAACGRPEVIRVSFTNPFPSTVRFFLVIPETSMRYLSVAASTLPQFTLGPKDTTNVLLVVRISDPVAQPVHLGASIVTDRGETVRVIDIRVTPSTPTVDRRYEVFGAAGDVVTKKFFSRVLSSNSFPLSLDTAALEKRIATLCCFCSTSDPLSVANTTAVVDPLTHRFCTAWEELTVQTTIPSTGSKTVLVHLFFDEDCVAPYETWELVVYSCMVTQSHNIFFGQTSTISVPFPCDRLYSRDAIADVVPAAAGSSTTNAIRIKPRGPGTVSILLHALRGADLDKIICIIPVSVPAPTFEQTIDVSATELSTPLFRRLSFTNHEAKQKVFRVNFNYRHNVAVNPEVFALGSGETQHLNLKFERLCVPEGLTEGRYPVWLFINDEQDRTVESYFLQVVARVLPVYA